MDGVSVRPYKAQQPAACERSCKYRRARWGCSLVLIGALFAVGDTLGANAARGFLDTIQRCGSQSGRIIAGHKKLSAVSAVVGVVALAASTIKPLRRWLEYETLGRLARATRWPRMATSCLRRCSNATAWRIYGDAVATENMPVVRHVFSNHPCMHGRTTINACLRVAFFQSKPNVMDFLLDHAHVGPDCLGDKLSDLASPHLMTGSDAVAMADVLLRHGVDVNFRTDEFSYAPTVLYRAVAENNVTMTRWLLRNGANVHVRHVNGQTPLHLAARHDWYDTAAALIERAPSCLIDRDSNGMTALHHWVRSAEDVRGYARTAQLGRLLVASYPACLNATDNAGRTALDYAITSNDTVAHEFLVAHGGVRG